MNINPNNAPEGDHTNVLKYGHLFKAPTGGQFPDIQSIAEDSLPEYLAFQAKSAAAAPLSVARLRSNVAALAPAARAAVCQLECFDTNFTPYGREDEITAPRVQGPPIFALFALNALALFEAEQGSGEPAIVEQTIEAPVVGEGGGGDVPPVTPDDTATAADDEPQHTWAQMADALKMAAQFALSVDQNTELDWTCNVDDAQELHGHLKLLSEATTWVLEQFNEQVEREVSFHHKAREDMKLLMLDIESE